MYYLRRHPCVSLIPAISNITIQLSTLDCIIFKEPEYLTIKYKNKEFDISSVPFFLCRQQE